MRDQRLADASAVVAGCSPAALWAWKMTGREWRLLRKLCAAMIGGEVFDAGIE